MKGKNFQMNHEILTCVNNNGTGGLLVPGCTYEVVEVTAAGYVHLKLYDSIYFNSHCFVELGGVGKLPERDQERLNQVKFENTNTSPENNLYVVYSKEAEENSFKPPAYDEPGVFKDEEGACIAALEYAEECNYSHPYSVYKLEVCDKNLVGTAQRHVKFQRA